MLLVEKTVQNKFWFSTITCTGVHFLSNNMLFSYSIMKIFWEIYFVKFLSKSSVYVETDMIFKERIFILKHIKLSRDATTAYVYPYWTTSFRLSWMINEDVSFNSTKVDVKRQNEVCTSLYWNLDSNSLLVTFECAMLSRISPCSRAMD